MSDAVDERANPDGNGSGAGDGAWFVFVASIAFFVRALYLTRARESPFFELLFVDARTYWEWSGRIAGGDVLGEGVFYQAPLYPYFLGGLRAAGAESLLAVRIVQALLGALACGLVYLAGRTAFSRPAGVAAGLVLAVYAPAVFLEAQIQKGALTLFLTAALVALLVRAARRPSARAQLAVGIILGLLVLTREEALLFVPVWGGWMWLAPAARGRRATHLAGFAVGLALALAPVALRNRAVGGELALTTSQAGPNFYIGNNPAADGAYAPLRAGRGDPRHERTDAHRLAEAAVGRELTPREVSRFWLARALGFVRAEPVAWLALVGRKGLLLANAHEIGDAEAQVFQERAVPFLGALARCAHLGLLLPLTAAGLWMARGRGAAVTALVLFGLTQAAAVVLFYVFARYRLPLVPVAAVFAGHALVEAGRAIRERRFGELAVPAALAAAVAVLANLSLVSDQDELATSHANVAAAFLEAGDEARFLEHTGRAIELGSLQALVNLGVAHARAGRPDEAARLFEQARARVPEDPRLEKRLGTALGEAGRWEDAVQHLGRSYDLFPDDPETAANLFFALGELGRLSELERRLAQHVARYPGDAGARAALAELRQGR